MLALTTERHKLFITVLGVSGGGGECFGGIGRAVDDAVDRLFEKCSASPEVIKGLAETNDQEQAYAVIAKELKGVVPGDAWIRNGLGRDLCRRVLYLMHPKRFMFEKYGWIH